MSESAVDRTSRALDLIPFLLEHQGISISELASEFRVSEKQITEDLTLIHMCGLPGYTPLELIDMYYEDGYVTVSDPQILTKPRTLNRSEITSLLIGLDLLKSIQSRAIHVEISDLQNRIRANLAVENPFLVVANHKISGIESDIQRAISKSQGLEIEYLGAKKDSKSTRKVLPLEIYIQNGVVYLDGWCQLSSADRTFRVDRILKCKIIGADEISIIPAFETVGSKSLMVKLSISAKARNFLEDNRAIFTEITRDGPGYTVTTEIDSEWLLRSLLGFGGLVTIIEPSELALELKTRASEILRLYS